MLILTDKALAAAKVDYATAIALLQPAEGELIVHVRQELGPSDYVPPPSLTDGGGSLRHTDRASSDVDQLVPTEEPPKSTEHPQAETRGYSFADLEQMAEKQRLTLTCSDGVYTVQGVMGMSHFRSASDCVAALRYGRW